MDCFRASYSWRSARVGSRRHAGHAGSEAAPREAASTAATLSAKIGGSAALTPKSWLSTKRPQRRPVATPAAIPKTMTASISRRTSRITWPRSAPNAIRIPISRVRRATTNDITPCRPATARRVARSREIHKRLVEGVRGGAGNPGRYREIQNYVVNSRTREVIYTPPSPEQVPPLMGELVEWIRGETAIHPVLGAGIAQFQLVHIHPFVDGNGRTSRLLSTLCLYRAGYDFKRLFTLSEFYDRNRSDFYRAIQSVREEEMDLTSWLEYFVGGLATQLDDVKARGTAAIRADVIGRANRLNGRQSALLTEL